MIVLGVEVCVFKTRAVQFFKSTPHPSPILMHWLPRPLLLFRGLNSTAGVPDYAANKAKDKAPSAPSAG